MNRRDSLKALGLGAVSAGLLLEACKTDNKKAAEETTAPAAGTEADIARQPFEIERDKKLFAAKFFTVSELATITVLADIIIPRDDKSGSASDAKVPEFIEFIVKDMPEHQTPVRGGLRWLDLQCLNRYSKVFTDCSSSQQIELIDMIAYPNKAKPEMAQGVAFFNRMRDLTASGFFTSEIGVKDVGYMGNQPNKWNGVPDEILKHYGMENV